MRHIPSPRAAIVAALCAQPLLLSAPAFAAPPPPPAATATTNPSPAPMAPSAMGSPGAMQNENTPNAAPLPKAMAAKVEAHIKTLRDQLAITPAQEPQWDQYAQVMREDAATMHQAFNEREAQLPGMNAMQNMESYAKLASVHAENMQKLSNAFASLYAALSPAQQQKADMLFQHKAEKMAHHHKA